MQNPNRRDLEREVSGYDIPHVFQVSYVYQLPFGKGHRLGGGWNGLMEAVLGGWQTNGLWRFDAGMPISLGLSTSQALPTYGTQRPNLLRTLKRNDGPDWMNQYFADPTAVATPAPFTLGTAPRNLNDVRIPGTATTALREGARLDFRVEAFNALNHPQFAGPNTTVGAAAFGRVTAQANTPRQMQLGLKLYF